MELGGQIVRKVFVLLICVMLNYQMFDVCVAHVHCYLLRCVRLLFLCVICYVCLFWDVVRV